MDGVLRYLLSRANLFGLAAATAVALVGAFGLLGGWWLPLTAGAYVVGALLAPSEGGHRIDLEAEREAVEVRRSLDELVRVSKRHLEPEVTSRVQRIRTAVLAVIDDRMEPAVAQHWETIVQTTLEYLPSTLENYLNVPNLYRRSVRGRGGRTPLAELTDQLDLLADQMEAVATDVSAGALEDLQDHGEFLKVRFSDPMTW